MSLRTSLQRLTRRDPAAPSLRERLTTTTTRLAETKDRAGKAVKVARILMTPPEPAPEPVDRLALINYATWLANERRLLCHEIYPEAGPDAHRFISANVAAEDFHFPFDGQSWRDIPPPSSRAMQALDRLGIEWRADQGERADIDPQGEPGEPAPTPHGWPAIDAALLEALDDLSRLDAAQAAMHIGDDREGDTVPGYAALEEARADALDRLAETRAESLTGLQAKAWALLTRSVIDAGGPEAGAIAQSLARDLTGARQSTIEPRPDPSRTAIAELDRLEVACRAAWEADDSDAGTLARRATETAVTDHWRSVVLKTVPTTARGCADLARAAAAYHRRWGTSLDSDDPSPLDLIARSPLL